MKIWSAEVMPNVIENDIVTGTVIKANEKEGLIVSTGDGMLRIIELQMPNAKKMLVTDYLRGNSIAVGSILHG